MSKEKLLINDSKSNNGEVMRNKQIEEMTKDLCDIDCKGMKCDICDSYGCEYRMQAEAIYNAGYRKQSENTVEVIRCKDCEYHHWEQEPCHGKTIHKCSVLNAEVFKDFYCYHGKPKMKGGAE